MSRARMPAVWGLYARTAISPRRRQRLRGARRTKVRSGLVSQRKEFVFGLDLEFGVLLGLFRVADEYPKP